MNEEIDVEKIRGLLEKARDITKPSNAGSCCAIDIVNVDEFLDQALSLLKPPCKTEAEVRHPIDSECKVNHKRNYCYQCGTTVKDQKFCHGCGRKLKWPVCCLKPCSTASPATLLEELFEACAHLTAQAKYVKELEDGIETVNAACVKKTRKLEAENRKLKNQKEYIYKPEIDRLKGIIHGDSAIAIIEQLEEGAFAANEEAQARDDRIKQLEGEKGMLEEQFRQPHKCMGCDEKIYYQSYCKRCNRQWQS